MNQFLLADIEGFGVVIFLVVSFISWILNMKNDGQKKQANRPPNRPQPKRGPAQAGGGRKPEALKSELEAFLEEVTGQKKPAPRQQQRPPIEPAKVPRKRVERKPDGPRPQPASIQRQKPRQQPKPKPQPKPKSERSLGSKLRDHVEDYMGNERIEQHVQEHLHEGVHGRVEKRIGRSVEENIDGPSISATQSRIEVDPKPASTQSLIRMLRDPSSVRNAVLLNEILQRPLAMRKNQK